MARLPRIELPHIPQHIPQHIPPHIIQRGNNHSVCFGADDDFCAGKLIL